MNILRLNAYFDPEITAASHLMNDLYEGFSKNNIICYCVTPEPTRGVSDEIRKEYKKKRKEELYEGTLFIERFRMFREKKNPVQRALRYIACSFIHYYKGINKKNIDLVFSGSTPPTNGIISAMVAKKLTKKYNYNVPFVYELQDIFPDSMLNSKLTNKDSFLWKIGRKMEDYTYKNADTIIVPTEAMKKNIINKGVNDEKIQVISNWIDLEKVDYVTCERNKLYKELSLSKKEFIVLYAGNFGEAQGADIVLKVAEKLQKFNDIRFVIFGGGTYFEDAKQYVKDKGLNNILINSLLPQDRVSEVYSLGDLAVITCKSGTGNAGMPSKTWSIMACNTPIVASFDKESELDYVLKKSNAGKCVEPENINELSRVILDYYHKWKECVCLNIDSREYVKTHASKDACVYRYIDVLKRVNFDNNKN